jgi:predicted PurR-regulated permease PerM
MRTLPQPGALTLLVSILITCLLLFLFQKMIWFVVPFLLALMLCYCLRPAVGFLMVHGMSHNAAARAVWLLLQLTVVVALIAGAFWAMGRAGAWGDDVSHYTSGGRNLIVQSIAFVEERITPLQEINLSAQAEQQFRQFSDSFAEKNLLPIALLALKWLPSVLLVPYLAYFMLIDAVRLKKYLMRSVPNAFFEKALLLSSRLDASLQNYFQGLFQLTLLDTLFLALGLAALGIHHAIWLGLAAAILAWIPYIGSIFGAVLVVMVSATDFPEKAWVSYACLALFAAGRMLDDLVFLPLTIGRKLRVHPVLSVLMLFLGATVAGATGLVLVLPLFGVVAVVGESVAQVISDPKLQARYKISRRLALAAVSNSLQ